MISDSDFCKKFIENDYKIDFGFNSGQGSDLKALLLIGHKYWEIDVNVNNLTLNLVLNNSSEPYYLETAPNYKMAFSGGNGTVGLIDVRTE